jgi:hypothetical protein
MTDNITPDFGWTSPFDSRQLEDGPIECDNPDFRDVYMHRMARMKHEHFGSPGDRDENGIPGWVVKKICNGCGREFGERVFIVDKMPKRIQRKRTKGWRMPPNTVYVGRPTKWGNPFRIGETINCDDIGTASLYAKDHGWCGKIITPHMAVKLYQWWLSDCLWYADDETLPLFSGLKKLDIEELRGKNLACWCPLDQPCHANVLLEIANGVSDTPQAFRTGTETANR